MTKHDEVTVYQLSFSALCHPVVTLLYVSILPTYFTDQDNCYIGSFIILMCMCVWGGGLWCVLCHTNSSSRVHKKIHVKLHLYPDRQNKQLQPNCT